MGAAWLECRTPRTARLAAQQRDRRLPRVSVTLFAFASLHDRAWVQVARVSVSPGVGTPKHPRAPVACGAATGTGAEKV
jgi:hypothetical protein